MQNCNCPSCGAAIIFQSSISVTAVCTYCHSLVVRHDVNVEAIGTMAELPPDMSPFQIGTGGTHKGVHFTLIGRARIAWEDGAWNEWFMLRDDNSKAWLAEAQGSVCVNAEVPEENLPEQPPRMNHVLKLGGTSYRVTDVKEAECIGSEGELPFIAKKGRKTVSVDLTGKAGAFASIEYSNGEKPRLFLGEYVEFDILKFTNLRELPGWDGRQVKLPGKATP